MEKKHKQIIDIIYQDFNKIGNVLYKCTEFILQNSKYQYPIIIATEDDTSFGISIIKTGERDNLLNYEATYLDLLVNKEIIPENEIGNFKHVYDKNQLSCCIMAVSQDWLNFIHLPMKHLEPLQNSK